jgi:hypothetical protein
LGLPIRSRNLTFASRSRFVFRGIGQYFAADLDNGELGVAQAFDNGYLVGMEDRHD